MFLQLKIYLNHKTRIQLFPKDPTLTELPFKMELIVNLNQILAKSVQMHC